MNKWMKNERGAMLVQVMVLGAIGIILIQGSLYQLYQQQEDLKGIRKRGLTDLMVWNVSQQISCDETIANAGCASQVALFGEKPDPDGLPFVVVPKSGWRKNEWLVRGLCSQSDGKTTYRYAISRAPTSTEAEPPVLRSGELCVWPTPTPTP